MVRGEIAVELHHRAGGAERVVAGVHVNRGLIENRRNHLRRHEALPDQLVQLEHIVVEKAPHVFRRARNIGRTNRFVRFLRVFLRLVEIRLFRQVALAVARSDLVAHLGERVGGDVHRIRAHVGDQRDRAFVSQLDAFIESLRQRHGALRRVAQAVVGGLLQLRSREGRRREAALFLLRDARNLPDRMIDRGENSLRLGLVGNFDVLAVVLDELGFKRRRLAGAEQRVNRPIFLGDERANLALALDDQPQRHGLHASGGKSAANLVPQQRRNFVAHQAIEHAARLLRIHQICVHFRRDARTRP